MNELGCVWHASCVTCETYVRKKIKIYLSTFHLIWGEREKERYRTREKEKERERESERKREIERERERERQTERERESAKLMGARAELICRWL